MINWGIPLGRETALRPLVATFLDGGGEDSECLQYPLTMSYNYKLCATDANTCISL